MQKPKVIATQLGNSKNFGNCTSEDTFFTLRKEQCNGVMFIGGGGGQTEMKIPEATKQGFAVAKEGDSINLAQPNSTTRRGRVGVGVANTLDTQMEQYTLKDQRIRRLTPRECCFLQGFSKDYTKWGITKYANATKENAIEVLQTVWETISEDDRERRGFAKFITLLKKEILRQELYESELLWEIQVPGFTTGRALSCQAIGYCDRMCEMWEQEKSGYTPQRQKQIEQLIRELAGIVPKLPYEITLERGRTEYRIYQKPTEKRDGQIYSFQLISDSQRYRCLGNAVSVPVVSAVIRRVFSEQRGNV
jgi:site-specific DNA-cytosine methylase